MKYLVSAAGGNTTVIQLIENSQTREWYSSNGNELIKKYDNFEVEQSGFLIPKDLHFEMAGGEFCGNASRAAAAVFSILRKESIVDFTVSGFNGIVHSTVNKYSDNEYNVESIFNGMNILSKEVKFSNGTQAFLVDLGGIVHIVIEGELPSNYKDIHKEVTSELGLLSRSAVGVVWYTKRENKQVKIHPIIWVNQVNTFYYETSCGSASIAVAVVTGINEIEQVTGEFILTKISKEFVSLKSKIKVLYIE
ncbi:MULTISPECIES: hypothetical protein [unclassified Clostridium]|uniref:hypothetical protein n=1 Tax=unclassified Clostridium TaxID=2614128 RepID=UPI0025C51100|nr:MULTISPECIES: hypothetical protein [unclassified Clostridium]